MLSLHGALPCGLRRRMAASGSPEYVLTWKHWDMPSGPPICALRARAPRTSDHDCGGLRSASASEAEPSVAGWPTPKATEDGRTLEQYEAGRLRGYEKRKRWEAHRVGKECVRTWRSRRTPRQ